MVSKQRTLALLCQNKTPPQASNLRAISWTKDSHSSGHCKTCLVCIRSSGQWCWQDMQDLIATLKWAYTLPHSVQSIRCGTCWRTSASNRCPIIQASILYGHRSAQQVQVSSHHVSHPHLIIISINHAYHHTNQVSGKQRAKPLQQSQAARNTPKVSTVDLKAEILNGNQQKLTRN